MPKESPEHYAARKKAFLLTHSIAGGVDDPEQPPETPPGDPSQEQPETPPAEPNPLESPKQTAPVQPVFSTDQINDLAKGISQGLVQGLKPADAPPPSAQLPAGPSMADLTAKRKQLDEQIDLAVTEGKPISALQQQRDDIREQIFELEHVAPLRVQGSNSINAIVLDGARKGDPYFIKYEREIMSLLTPQIQQGIVLTPELVNGAISLIKGQHLSEILADENERQTRQRNTQQAPMPGATNSRARAALPKAPETIKERFGDRAYEAFQSKLNKGMTEDQFAQKMRFKNKADWFQKDQEMSAPDFNIGLDSYWDKKNNRWVTPDEMTEFYNG